MTVRARVLLICKSFDPLVQRFCKAVSARTPLNNYPAALNDALNSIFQNGHIEIR